jgi:predicted ester cyclase
MSSMLSQAQLFFDACETGKGWDGCRPYCHADASFSSQTGALAGITTLEAYCNWMRDLFIPVPDGRYEIKCVGADEARKTVAVYAVFHGTQTGPGGPGGPTGKTTAADYVYAMTFEGDRISSMTKIWNDTISLQQLGWA